MADQQNRISPNSGDTLNSSGRTSVWLQTRFGFYAIIVTQLHSQPRGGLLCPNVWTGDDAPNTDISFGKPPTEAVNIGTSCGCELASGVGCASCKRLRLTMANNS